MTNRHIRPTNDDDDGGPVIIVLGMAAVIFVFGVGVGVLLW
jgi:hypothetical protein